MLDIKMEMYVEEELFNDFQTKIEYEKNYDELMAKYDAKALNEYKTRKKWR